MGGGAKIVQLNPDLSTQFQSGSGTPTGPIGGDVNGTLPGATTVVALQGYPLSPTPPTVGQTWVFDGTQWIPATPGTNRAVHFVTASGSALTVDFSVAMYWDITLTANCTITLAGAISGDEDDIGLILRQGGSGSYTISWPGTMTWPGGVAPTLATAVGDVDRVAVGSDDGGATWFGSYGGSATSGTVTSVGLSMPAEFSVASSPVTGSGTIAVTKATEAANTVWAGPTSGAAAAPTFRALVAADIPAGSGTVWAPLMIADLDGTHWNVLVDGGGNAIVVAE